MKLTGEIFKGFWKNHIKTIGLLAQGILLSKRAGIAAIGRHMPTATSPKHNIKRVDYFLGQSKVDVLAGARAISRWLIGERREIYVSVDWTKVKEWPVLVASIVYRGRSLPLFWAAIEPAKMYRSMNHFEHAFFQLFKQYVLPKSIQCVVIMDRGFKRMNLLRQLDALGYGYVVRSGGCTEVRHPKYKGKLQDWITRRGVLKALNRAQVRKTDSVTCRLVGCWDNGQKSPWILSTNLSYPKRVIVRIYGKRFQIEESFRDKKCSRFGLGLSQTKVSNVDRLEKLFFLVVIAHIYAMLLGEIAVNKQLDKLFRANTVTSRRTHSLFTLGVYYWHRMRWRLADFYAALQRYQTTKVLT
jgi:hypothetical protein